MYSLHFVLPLYLSTLDIDVYWTMMDVCIDLRTLGMDVYWMYINFDLVYFYFNSDELYEVDITTC